MDFNTRAVEPVMTAVKAKVAAVGATLTAVTAALATWTVVSGDGRIETAEVSTLIVAGVTLFSTVFAVWRVPNKVDSSKSGIQE